MMTLCIHFYRITSFAFILASLMTVRGSSTEKGPFWQQVTPAIIHAEGPHWDPKAQVLYFIDLLGKSAHKYDPKTGKMTSTSLGGLAGVMVPVEGSTDQFVAGVERNLLLVQWDGISIWSKKTILDTVQLGTQFNDGKADAKGHFWIGTVGIGAAVAGLPPKGILYDFSPDLCKLRKDVPGITESNGMAWSHDNKLMYYVDTTTRRVDVFDYDIATSSVSNRRPVFDYEANNVPGSPDGMTIDTDGHLWVACWMGSRVIKIDPLRGTLILSVVFPLRTITSVTFGGPNLDILYVTTSKMNLTVLELLQLPMAGSVLAVTKLGARGYPAKSAVLCDKYK